jgi:IclR family transcriptional regulator, acetate operon repressor
MRVPKGESIFAMANAIGNRIVDRTCAIFEAFEDRRRPMNLRELAAYCSIPVSTCHAIVHTLIERAYLYQTSRRKDLYPTRRILDIAKTIVAHDPYLERITPILKRLQLRTQETVILGKRQGDQVLYLEVLESAQKIRYSARAGEFKPLHSSAIGKVMLGGMSPEDLREWLRQRSLPKVTANTITSCAKLSVNLDQSRRLGYFITRGENVSDVTAIAAPVLVNGELLGIAVAGPTHRMKESYRKHTTELLEARSTVQGSTEGAA